jgi:hypothetical protein
MHTLCHRCNGDLPSGGGPCAFCPHCGAPQLLLSEDYLADQPPQAAEGADTTGALPPPLPRQVEWQTALRCAAFVAAIAALLCVVALRVPGVSLFSTVWILTASTTTLALYHRRLPLAWMDAAVGARIGLATGVVLIALITASMALAGVVARFGLHAMAGFDADFAQMIVQVKETARQTASSSSTPPPAELLHLYDLPEFQAGLMLATVTTGAIFLLVFSTFGGAVNGLLRNRRRARV